MEHLRFELISESHPCSTSFFEQKVSNLLEAVLKSGYPDYPKSGFIWTI